MEQNKFQAEYFREQLEKGIRNIFTAQISAASDKISRMESNEKSRSGRLMDSLRNPDYSLTVQGAGVYAVIRYPITIRFCDIKYLGNWKVYNKPIWGILYNEILPNIKYEFSDWLRERMKRQIKEAVNQ